MRSPVPTVARRPGSSRTAVVADRSTAASPGWARVGAAPPSTSTSITSRHASGGTAPPPYELLLQWSHARLPRTPDPDHRPGRPGALLADLDPPPGGAARCAPRRAAGRAHRRLIRATNRNAPHGAGRSNSRRPAGGRRIGGALGYASHSRQIGPNF